MHGDVDTHHTTKLKGQDRSRSKFQRSNTSKPESFTTFMWDPIASFAVPKTRYVLKVAANSVTPAAHCTCTDAIILSVITVCALPRVHGGTDGSAAGSVSHNITRFDSRDRSVIYPTSLTPVCGMLIHVYVRVCCSGMGVHARRPG